MPWFYNSISGELANESGVAELAYQAALHTGTGWHELNISGSATFEQAAAEALKEVPGGATPTGSQITGLEQAPTGIAKAAAGDISKSILGPLFQANIWIRVGEVMLGLLLLAVGLARITHAVPIATKVAKTVGAVGLV